MTYEKEITEKIMKGESTSDRLEIPLLKYLWDAGPISFLSKEGYHDFFKKITPFVCQGSWAGSSLLWRS